MEENRNEMEVMETMEGNVEEGTTSGGFDVKSGLIGGLAALAIGGIAIGVKKFAKKKKDKKEDSSEGEKKKRKLPKLPFGKKKSEETKEEEPLDENDEEETTEE